MNRFAKLLYFSFILITLLVSFRVYADNSIAIPDNSYIQSEYRKFFSGPHKRQLQVAYARKLKLQPIFDELLEKYQIPKEILAIPYVESGYYSFPRSKRHPYTAGAWQMIPETARRNGLIVNKTIDQRLDIKLETEAALHLIRGMYDEFQDWQLTILAYNAGAYKVRQVLNKTRQTDAWALIAAGHFKRNTPYLSKINAAAKILNQDNLLAQLELIELVPYQPQYFVIKRNVESECDLTMYHCFYEQLLLSKQKKSKRKR